jgi:hypothetical protein
MRDLGFEGRDQWDPAFYVYAAILFVGAFGWLWIDTTRPVEPPPPPTVVEVPPTAEPSTGIIDQELVRGIREARPAS